VLAKGHTPLQVNMLHVQSSWGRIGHKPDTQLNGVSGDDMLVASLILSRWGSSHRWSGSLSNMPYHLGKAYA